MCLRTLRLLLTIAEAFIFMPLNLDKLKNMLQTTSACYVSLKVHPCQKTKPPSEVFRAVYSTFGSVMDIPAPNSVFLLHCGSVGSLSALARAYSSHRFKLLPSSSDSVHLLLSPPPPFLPQVPLPPKLPFPCLPRLRFVTSCSPPLPSTNPQPERLLACLLFRLCLALFCESVSRKARRLLEGQVWSG